MSGGGKAVYKPRAVAGLDRMQQASLTISPLEPTSRRLGAPRADALPVIASGTRDEN